LLAAAAGTAPAGEIYKSVDANGNVVYSDHADPATAQLSVIALPGPHSPPDEMHVCGTKNCFTLKLDNGSYRRVDGADDTWTIETFSTTAVVLRRHGAASANADVTYSGDVANDRLINVKVNGIPTGGFDASWGTALNTLPGTNAERDANILAIMNAPVSGTISAAATPPPLPDEDQSEIPDPGYLWTPGYWYWRDRGYFWVPGSWVRPPQAGFLWTPGFWGLAGAVFVFHPGYWGPTVGYYGGTNYGHGYFGSGYTGGRWVAGTFLYNSSVNHLSGAVQHRYSEPPPHQSSGRVRSYDAGAAATSAIHASVGHPSAPTPIAARQVATGSNPGEVATTVSNRSTPTVPSVAAPPKLNHSRPIKSLPPKN